MRKMILVAATLAALTMMPAGANAQSSTIGGAIVGAGTGAGDIEPQAAAAAAGAEDLPSTEISDEDIPF